MDESPDRFQLDEESISKLLGEAKNGSDTSRSQLLEQLYAYLTWLAKSQLESRLKPKIGPSDLVQQSYALAIENLEDFRGTTPEELRGWLRQILLNELKKQRRRFRSNKRDVDRERVIHADSQHPSPNVPADSLPTPGTNALAQEQAAALEIAMSRLPDQYRTVIQLKNWQQMTFKQIGEQINRSPEAAAKLWYRALAKLHEEMESLE